MWQVSLVTIRAMKCRSIVDIQADIDLFRRAIRTVALGQSMTFNGRSITRSSLPDLRRELNNLLAELQQTEQVLAGHGAILGIPTARRY